MMPLVPCVEPEFAVTQQRSVASQRCKILPKARTRLGASLNFALTLTHASESLPQKVNWVVRAEFLTDFIGKH